jgi:hypothetical protein
LDIRIWSVTNEMLNDRMMFRVSRVEANTSMLEHWRSKTRGGRGLMGYRFSIYSIRRSIFMARTCRFACISLIASPVPFDPLHCRWLRLEDSGARRWSLPGCHEPGSLRLGFSAFRQRRPCHLPLVVRESQATVLQTSRACVGTTDRARELVHADIEALRTQCAVVDLAPFALVVADRCAGLASAVIAGDTSRFSCLPESSGAFDRDFGPFFHIASRSRACIDATPAFWRFLWASGDML